MHGHHVGLGGEESTLMALLPCMRCAGGRDDVRTCYLKESLQRDPNIASFAYSYAPPYLHRDWPEVCTLHVYMHGALNAACVPRSPSQGKSGMKLAAVWHRVASVQMSCLQARYMCCMR